MRRRKARRIRYRPGNTARSFGRALPHFQKRRRYRIVNRRRFAIVQAALASSYGELSAMVLPDGSPITARTPVTSEGGKGVASTTVFHRTDLDILPDMVARRMRPEETRDEIVSAVEASC